MDSSSLQRFICSLGIAFFKWAFNEIDKLFFQVLSIADISVPQLKALGKDNDLDIQTLSNEPMYGHEVVVVRI